MDVDASSMASARLIIGGMSCASCAASVESVLQVPPPQFRPLHDCQLPWGCLPTTHPLISLYCRRWWALNLQP